MSDTREDLLRKAEAQLAAATTPAEVQAAHTLLRKAIHFRRRTATQEWGPLAQTFMLAMQNWDTQTKDGVSLAERAAGLEKSLRASWPQVRVWKYGCEACADTGWVLRVCTPETPCGRPFRLPGASGEDHTGRGACPPDHTSVRPCGCEAGEQRQRAMAGRDRRPADLADAGKSRKPTRIGRAEVR